MPWTEEQKRAAWQKAVDVDGKNPNVWKKDCCGAWIRWEDYGDLDSEYGWEIDHIFPENRLETFGVPKKERDAIENLRAMHYANNRSKGDDYPRYIGVRTAEGDNNKEIEKIITINTTTQNIINGLYGEYFEL